MIRLQIIKEVNDKEEILSLRKLFSKAQVNTWNCERRILNIHEMNILQEVIEFKADGDLCNIAEDEDLPRKSGVNLMSALDLDVKHLKERPLFGVFQTENFVSKLFKVSKMSHRDYELGITFDETKHDACLTPAAKGIRKAIEEDMIAYTKIMKGELISGSDEEKSRQMKDMVELHGAKHMQQDKTNNFTITNYSRAGT